MSDVNSLFKKKKGKSKALDLKAAVTVKKPAKTKAEKQKEAADDDEWKSETKKAVVMTNGKAVEEFGKVYTNEEIVYEEDLDMSTKLDMDDTRKMLQDVIQRSTATGSEEDKEKEEQVEEVVEVKPASLSLEERFARASTSSFSSKYVARGGSMSAAPKKTLDEEYPTLGAAVVKSAPAPTKKTPKTAKLETAGVPETVFKTSQEDVVDPVVTEKLKEVQVSEEVSTPVAAPAETVKTELEKTEVEKTEVIEKEVAEVVKTEVAKYEDVLVKKEVKKKKKKGGAFEI